MTSSVERLWQHRGQARPAFAVEPGKGQESVWDYPRPPVLVEDSRLVEVRIDECLIARTRHAVRVLETASPPTFYLPREDSNMGLLRPASGHSFCEWKGQASYFDLCYEMTFAYWDPDFLEEKLLLMCTVWDYFPADVLNSSLINPEPCRCSLMETQDVIEAFEFLETWEERFELIADLSRELAPLADADRTVANLVPGCTTRTWLTGRVASDSPILDLRADAETPLVKGLVALLLMPFRGKTPAEVLKTDPRPFVERLGLEQALSAKRQAGMGALFERINRIAREYVD